MMLNDFNSINDFNDFMISFLNFKIENLNSYPTTPGFELLIYLASTLLALPYYVKYSCSKDMKDTELPAYRSELEERVKNFIVNLNLKHIYVMIIIINVVLDFS
jgi:hypothetical protein